MYFVYTRKQKMNTRHLKADEEDCLESPSPLNKLTSLSKVASFATLPPMPTNGSLQRLARKVTFRRKEKKSDFEDAGIIDAFKDSMNGHDISIHLKFHDMSLTLPCGKTILNGVTGEIEPGRFTAIMGPSGLSI
jgi:ABC-type multidrug transport system fused ATPase/permease subunit